MLFETDKHGYLKNITDWTENVAEFIAQQENIALTPEHWLIIHTLRTFYLSHQLLPSMRVLIKLLAEKIPDEKNHSLYLQNLFPKGLMRQASKIAGLPKPVRCI